MKRQLMCSLAALITLGLSFGPVTAQPESPALAAPVEEGIDVQTRGPVHEAFAQPYSPDPQPTPSVPREPPPPVPEQPPEQKPPGDNVQWIPGYWSWDAERNDFTWVSGLWRVPPPGREWVPGSWTQADGGWRWLPGAWKDANQEQIVFQEGPPASLENGPAVPAPDDNSFYVPGCWVNRAGQYLWRPGFWQAFQPGWVWTDAQYTWTPRGCVFTGGYWDYAPEERGLPFAPAVFTQPLWDTPGWSYRPRFALGWDGLFGSLFARRGDRHYYFGDYYDARYRRAGFEPWHAARGRVRDALFDYARWQHRGDRGWYAGVVDGYQGRLQGSLPRPPRTFAEQSHLLRQGHGGRDVSRLRMVTTAQQLHGNPARFRDTTAIQRAGRRVDVSSARSASRTRSLAERTAAVSTVHDSARVTSSAPRPLPRPGSRYAENHRPAGPQGPHPVPRQGGPHERPLTPAQAHGYVAAASGSVARPGHQPAVAAHPAARPQQARAHAAASARPAARPGPAAARSAPPRQARQPFRPVRSPAAGAAPRRAASPRPASQPRQRPAASHAARASSRPAPRASGHSGSATSGKHH